MKEKAYVGIDLGKREMVIKRINPDETIDHYSTKTDIPGRKRLLNWLHDNDVVGIEVCALAFVIAKEIQTYTKAEVIVLNAGDLAMIYASLKKTDSEDALKIARIIKRNPRKELPEVRIPDEEEELIRSLSHSQEYWVTCRTRAINRLHALFTHKGITTIAKKDLHTKIKREKATEVLNGLIVKEESIRLKKEIDLAEESLKALHKEIKEILKKHIDKVKIMLSVPGVGEIIALAVLGYMGDPSRFSNSKQVAYYVGLVPKVDISGNTRKYGKIVKRGCHQIRRTIIQGAWALVKSEHGMYLRMKFEELRARKGSKKAIVAIARKMVELLYTLLKKQECYRYVPDAFIEKKMKAYGLL